MEPAPQAALRAFLGAGSGVLDSLSASHSVAVQESVRCHHFNRGKPLLIDTSFDFGSDTPEGKDPDSHSKTLRQYHKLLWSKPLPSGHLFDLSDSTPGHYLYHRSRLGEFSLTSDSVIPTFKWNSEVRAMIPQEDLDAFNALGYTIGGMMVFPGNRIDGKWTINQARGCTKAIGDRFDLTLECIRRHYIGLASPLGATLERYADFFHLFSNFAGYVEFYLLQDLVTTDFRRVKIAEPFDDFLGSPIPATVQEYVNYRTAAEAFISSRNSRIRDLVHAGIPA